MRRRTQIGALWRLALAVAGIFVAASAAAAQPAAAPTRYSITETVSLIVPNQSVKVDRDGDWAVLEQSVPPQTPGDPVMHTRSYYDLAKGLAYTVDLADPAMPCGGSRFSGDWGDPFAMSADFTAQAEKAHPTDAGAETIGGIPTKVITASTQGVDVKLWIEPKTGLIIRMDMKSPAGGPPTKLLVTAYSPTPPPPAAFALPAQCASLVIAPPPPTEAERIAKETGGDAGRYVNAASATPSKTSCTVLISFVRAGTLEVVKGGYQLAVDTHADPDHPAHYATNVGSNGGSTFSGGGIVDMTGRIRDGVLAVENPSALFDVEATIDPNTAASALIHRACFGPRTRLYFVLDNPKTGAKGGDWLWVRP
jgi:hypothetical protein